MAAPVDADIPGTPYYDAQGETLTPPHEPEIVEEPLIPRSYEEIGRLYITSRLRRSCQLEIEKINMWEEKKMEKAIATVGSQKKLEKRLQMIRQKAVDKRTGCEARLEKALLKVAAGSPSRQPTRCIGCFTGSLL